MVTKQNIFHKFQKALLSTYAFHFQIPFLQFLGQLKLKWIKNQFIPLRKSTKCNRNTMPLFHLAVRQGVKVKAIIHFVWHHKICSRYGLFKFILLDNLRKNSESYVTENDWRTASIEVFSASVKTNVEMWYKKLLGLLFPYGTFISFLVSFTSTSTRFWF